MRRITWDPRKAPANLRKHRVSFVEAATVLADPLALYMQDLDDPERELGIGMSAGARVLVVVFSESGRTVRIISARVANRHERKDYEEG